MNKPGRKGINYGDVVKACKELEGQGESITVRKVLELTGGSFATVATHIRTWQENITSLKTAIALPEELIAALKETYLKMLDNERKLHALQLARERKNLDETLKQIVELESSVDKLEKQLSSTETEYKGLALGYERKLAAAEAKVADSVERERALQQQLETLRDQHNQSEIGRAIAETKCAEYAKQVVHSAAKNVNPQKTARSKK